MKYIKTFESYSVNETQDMMFMPVDPIKASAEVYSDIAKALRGKFQEALDKVEDATSEAVEEIGTKAAQILKSVENYFGTTADKVTYDMVVAKLGKANESFIDKYDAADPYDGHGETMTTPLKDVKGGVIQNIGHILQNILGINILTIGVLGSFVTWIAGVTVDFGMSLIYSIIGFIVVHIVRKLATMANL